MKLKSPKDKGSRHERNVAEILRFYGFEAQRTPLSGAIDNWKGDITTTFPFFIECKNTEKTKMLEWFKKADDQSGTLPPVIVWTCNNNDIYAFLRFTDFIDAVVNKPQALKSRLNKPKKQKREEVDDNLAFSKTKQARRPIKTAP